MRFLILSCNTGEGHNSAAKAIKEYFEKMGEVCEIKDALSFWSPEKSRIICKGHVFLYRNIPKLFGIGYRFEENHPPKKGKESIVYELMKNGCKSLLKILKKADYDAVICTHLFSAMMMTELRKNDKYIIPTYFVATDYTCYPCTNESSVDGYFIPHKQLTDEFIKGGISKERLIPSGIPVKSTFYDKILPENAKYKLHLPLDKKIVLLMCGSMGCGPIKTLTEELPQMLPEDAHLAVICGNNRKLYNKLNKDGHSENVSVVGYTTRVSLYMDAASLILTKAGGLSSTEAAVKGLPMIFVDAVPGCETKNLDFFKSNGFADTATDGYDLSRLVCSYLKDDNKLEIMSSRLKTSFDFIAVENIYNYIQRDIENGKV